MVKIAKQYIRNYTVIDNTIWNDKKISWKAKGIFGFLWSRPDDWNFYVDEVVKHSKDGIRSLQSGLSELEKYGYLIPDKYNPRVDYIKVLDEVYFNGGSL